MKRKPNSIRKRDWDAVSSPPLSSAMLKRMRKVSDAHPNMPVRVRGPQKKPTKIAVTIRYSHEVISSFRGQGPGWQRRMDEALKEWLKKQSHRRGPVVSGARDVSKV